MAIYVISEDFDTNIRHNQKIYYNTYNKIYYDSKYIDNYIETETLFDGIHDSQEFGTDTSSDKSLFTNNKNYRETVYG